MKLLGVIGASCLIAQTYAYHYLVNLRTGTGVRAQFSGEPISTDDTFACDFGPLDVNSAFTLVPVLTSCYDRDTRIPSDRLDVMRGDITAVVNLQNSGHFGCVSTGVNSAVVGKQYRCRPVDDISDPAAATTTTTSTTSASSTTTTTTSTTSSTTISSTSTTATPTCTGNSKGKKRGDGYKNACCLTNRDCINNCVKGKCDGPSPALPMPTNCKKGVQGNKNEKGLTNYCCTLNDDCQDTCINEVCGHYTRKGSSSTKYYY